MFFFVLALSGLTWPFVAENKIEQKIENYSGKDKYYIVAPYKKGQKSAVLNFNGDELHSWKIKARRLLLQPDCHLLAIRDNQNHKFAEYNWNGKKIWKFKAPGFVHHDLEVLDNGDLIFWYATGLSSELYEKHVHKSCRHKQMRDDVILQIDRGGITKWEWFAHDWLSKELKKVRCYNKEEKKKNPAIALPFSWESFEKSDLRDWAHPNSIQVFKENKWSQAGDKTFQPGNILISVRGLSKIYIIDRKTKKIIWEYAGDELSLEHPHEAKMIAQGFPGAGNILIFDNGDRRGYSRILEIDPQTKKTVWSYGGPGLFFSHAAGSQQRLKNGDTFISADENGELLIVNPKKEIVWDYIFPEDKTVKRAHLYEKNYCHQLLKIESK